MSIKDSRALTEHLHKFTEIDVTGLYQSLFSDKELIKKLAQGLKMPQNMEQIISETEIDLRQGYIKQEDALAILYLKLKLDGEILYSNIKQVVIDEAQDYYPIHYEIFKLLFSNSRYTIMGDVHQAIEKNAESTIYDEIIETLDKKKAVKLTLNKSYRASFEINSFARKILNEKQDFIAFERHEAQPEIIAEETEESLIQKMKSDLQAYLDQGLETVAIICKTLCQAKDLHMKMDGFCSVSLVGTKNDEIDKGVMIIPVYMAKGLEFDAVMVYAADASNYSDNFDRKLLYVACTRALHRLSLYYSGMRTPLIK